MKDVVSTEDLKVFTSMEMERSKIAVILQEDIAQLVAIANIKLVKSPEITLYLKEAIAKLTSLAFEIKPQILENFGLHFALTELLDRRLGCKNYKQLIAPHLIDALHPTIRIVVFRLIQNILNSPYRSVIGKFVLQAELLADYLSMKVTFDIGFYSDALEKELLIELNLAIAPIIYLFNGHHLIKTKSDQIVMNIYVKMI
jgi:signal transduction histidine kinase